jgi:superfamily II DNA/RNA helicase
MRAPEHAGFLLPALQYARRSPPALSLLLVPNHVMVGQVVAVAQSLLLALGMRTDDARQLAEIPAANEPQMPPIVVATPSELLQHAHGATLVAAARLVAVDECDMLLSGALESSTVQLLEQIRKQSVTARGEVSVPIYACRRP